MLDEDYLSHIDRLRYLKNIRPETFRRMGNKKLQKFLSEVDRLPSKGGSEASISRILSQPGTGQWLECALQESSALRAKIENALAVGDIFGADGSKQIDALFSTDSDNKQPSSAMDVGLVTLHPVKRVVVKRATTHPHMGSQERAAARKLKTALVCGEFPVVHWPAEPWSGAPLAARSLASHPDLSALYSEIVFVRCTNPEAPFLKEMRDLAAEFGEQPSDGRLPVTLAEIVHRQKLLLVFCDACHLPARSNWTHAEGQPSRIFVDEMVRAHESGPCRLLSIGRSMAMEEVLERHGSVATSSALAGELIDALRYTGSRFKDYRKMEAHYRAARAIPEAMIEGNRLKRAQWHYETDQVRLDREVWPANLRLRAFFASDLGNFGYFDPTRGFAALAGPRPWPEDIEMLHDDIVGYLRLAEVGSRRSELHALRYCSTALHWLSYGGYEALVRPSTHCPKGDVRLREVKLDTFENIVADDRTPLRAPLNTFNRAGHVIEKKVFALGIGIKALVQDQWRRSEPEQRAEAHYRIAWRLWHQNQNKDVLREEFPYFPMQHRHSVFLAGETIRHLMAAAGQLDPDAHPELADVTGHWSEFPSAPGSEKHGCDPEDVVNFCYSEVYQRYINRNTWFNRGPRVGSAARALSKRHGAFGYAAELLQLMSEDGRLGKPHPALHPSFHPSFIRECGYALLDLGMLSQALECFQKLNVDATSVEERIFAKFDESLVLAELGNLKEVWKTLEEAEAMWTSLPRPKQKSSENTFRKRLTARAAHLNYLEGDFGLALMSLNKAETMTPEMTHIRFAAMAKMGVDPEIIAAKATNEVYKAANGVGQHEAIGFMIANAHAVRKFSPDAAEEALETVFEEVLRTGCSERTLLRLLLEAGRTLAAQGRLLRAFATYAYPCAVRARARGFARIANTAEELCYRLLRRIDLYQRAHTAKAWARAIAAAEKNDRITASNAEHGRSSTENDPLFGFFFDAPSPVLLHLASRRGIERLARDLRRSRHNGSRLGAITQPRIAITRERLSD
ncbi:hypothetical protein EU803_15890 [Loktanella sp. IMCC34160]|uniref:hypothetical protein n=1 Tax=Loktanella sp. IMCC34160 TaxID=2510646 RepID=UPI00101CF5AD|nr:hypothetical protein [Loktanella sp. IMCC34160]RYG90092.1 hypothetical protein EU803_15890 [Loktanella sp. IMCC34160]